MTRTGSRLQTRRRTRPEPGAMFLVGKQHGNIKRRNAVSLTRGPFGDSCSSLYSRGREFAAGWLVFDKSWRA